MKTISKILTAALVLAFVNKSQAQSTASADAFATIITPISIAKDRDMNFGNIAVQSSTSQAGAVGGTVVLSPAGGRTVTGGVSLPTAAGTVQSARFNVTGDGNRTYAITLPGTIQLTVQGGGTATMSVGTFTSTPSGTGQLNNGSQFVEVGATLAVSLDQTPGTYAGSFEVTVNYN